MFTKNTIVLAILLRVTAGAFAETKKQQTPPERVYINNPPPAWQIPDLKK
jgi:hypothetical protein